MRSEEKKREIQRKYNRIMNLKKEDEKYKTKNSDIIIMIIVLIFFIVLYRLFY